MIRRLIVVSRYRLKSTPRHGAQRRQDLLVAAVLVRRLRPTAGVGSREVGMMAELGQPRAISSGGSTKSTQPLSIALRGMPGTWRSCSSCAKVIPPTALISHRPSVPSEPVPESTTPIARACWSSASERNRWSIGRCGPCAFGARGQVQHARPRSRCRRSAGSRRRDWAGPPCPCSLRRTGMRVALREQVGQPALVLRVEVLDQHERHAGVGGQVARAAAERLEAAGEAPMPTTGNGSRPLRLVGRTLRADPALPLRLGAARRGSAHTFGSRLSSSRSLLGWLSAGPRG